MATKRKKIPNTIIKDRQAVRNRNPRQYGYEEPSETHALIEGERFSWEEAQGDFIPLTYAPSKTSWPGNGHDHRRTTAAGYSRETGILRVEFYTNGAVYDYGVDTPVPPYIAYQYRTVQSPGRFINAVLEGYGYQRVN
jgi:hypothetical protein